MTYVCENCGNSHNGTYGSGRFCSKSCRMRYIGKQSNKNGKLNGHPQFNTGTSSWKPSGNWSCPYCPAILDSRRLRTKHIREEHYHTDVPLKHAWNKGLTKETSDKVAQFANTLKQKTEAGLLLPPGKRVNWTDELRQAQSERKKALYIEHPEKHPNAMCAGNKKKMTYPEQITCDWLNSYGIKAIHNFHYVSKKFNRYVDFYVPHLKLFIEVDGSYWHKDKTRDINKDKDAKENGFYTLRLNTKVKIIDQLNEYFYELKY